MCIHCLQHVPFEGPANIVTWAAERGHTLTTTRLDLGEPLPPRDTIDWLTILGGPMNIHEHERYPWLAREKEFIRTGIARGIPVLGVCLGAQLAADVLGGPVSANPEKEIGWHPVRLTFAGRAEPLFEDFPDAFTPFHWHGDTFAVPHGATRVAESDACRNQAFVFNGRVVGLQFHIEYSEESIENMIAHSGHELVPGKYIQTRSELLKRADLRIETCAALLYKLLSGMERLASAA